MSLKFKLFVDLHVLFIYNNDEKLLMFSILAVEILGMIKIMLMKVKAIKSHAIYYAVVVITLCHRSKLFVQCMFNCFW